MHTALLRVSRRVERAHVALAVVRNVASNQRRTQRRRGDLAELSPEQKSSGPSPLERAQDRQAANSSRSSWPSSPITSAKCSCSRCWSRCRCRTWPKRSGCQSTPCTRGCATCGSIFSARCADEDVDDRSVRRTRVARRCATRALATPADAERVLNATRSAIASVAVAGRMRRLRGPSHAARAALSICSARVGMEARAGRAFDRRRLGRRRVLRGLARVAGAAGRALVAREPRTMLTRVRCPSPDPIPRPDPMSASDSDSASDSLCPCGGGNTAALYAGGPLDQRAASRAEAQHGTRRDNER